jgi:hypothetical protein
MKNQNNMNSLLAFTIEAHGGLDSWEKIKNVSARANIDGLMWVKKQQPGILKDVYASVDTKRQFVSYQPKENREWHTSFEPNRIATETSKGEVIDELLNPRQSFSGHTIDTAWTQLQVFYFASYAIWTYFNGPFNFANPDYEVQEVEPWEENNEQWRRLLVTFPKAVATHNPVQTFYIDQVGLIRRHDYNVEIIANATSSHYLYDYIKVQGINIATKRRVYVRKEDNTALMPEPVLVSLNLSELKFQ